MEKCPKCHSEQRVRADVVSEGNPVSAIRFKPEDVVTFRHRQRLQALACPSCGYLEFYLATDHDPEKPAGLGTWVFA
jgi:predicted nucleic-acid-binding Zn-ribbon protein